MSGNKLLKENTIRRFMKLANVGGLSDNFISEMGMKGSYKDEDEEELEELQNTKRISVAEAEYSAGFPHNRNLASQADNAWKA